MENDVKIVEMFITSTMVVGLIAIGLGWEMLTAFLPIVAIIISGLTLYFSRRVKDAGILLMKDDVEGQFFCDFSGDDEMVAADESYVKTGMEFMGGHFSFTLTFYNKGDRMSAVKIKEIELPDEDLIPTVMEDNFSVSPHTHYIYKPADLYFPVKLPVLAVRPFRIETVKITYSWTKKEKENKVTEKIPINCQVII